MKHLALARFQPELVDHWLALFDEACRELFDRGICEEFRARAGRIRSLTCGHGEMKNGHSSIATTHQPSRHDQRVRFISLLDA